MLNSLQNFQKLPRPLRRHKLIRLLSLPGGPIQLVRVNQSFDAFIDVRDGFARLIAIEDSFEPEFFVMANKLLSFNRESPVFFDVGANYGLMSLGLGLSGSPAFQAHLFEPNPHLVHIIKRSVALEVPDKFHIRQVGVMDRPGKFQLQFTIEHTGAGRLTSDGNGVTVEAITLDQYFRDQCLQFVDLMKIDVEGNETAVLKGGEEAINRDQIGAIYFEYCPSQIHTADPDSDPVVWLLERDWLIFQCRSFDMKGNPSHLCQTPEGHIPLRQITTPPDTRITDLLAIPRRRSAELVPCR